MTIEWMKNISRGPPARTTQHTTQCKTISFNFRAERWKNSRGGGNLLRGEAMSIKIHADVMQSFYSYFSSTYIFREWWCFTVRGFNFNIFEYQRITQTFIFYFCVTFFCSFFLITWPPNSNYITIHLVRPAETQSKAPKESIKGEKNTVTTTKDFK